MSEITIRTAEPADAANIAEICGSSLGYECSEAMVRERISWLDTSREHVFVAVKDGEVIGFIHADIYIPLYFDTLVNILGLAVADGSKRLGAGRKLMEAVEEWAGEIGAAGIRLNSGGSRTDAHAFYRAIGFGDEKTQIRFFKDM